MVFVSNVRYEFIKHDVSLFNLKDNGKNELKEKREKRR